MLIFQITPGKKSFQFLQFQSAFTCSKLTLETLETRHWHRSDVFIVNFEDVNADWNSTPIWRPQTLIFQNLQRHPKLPVIRYHAYLMTLGLLDIFFLHKMTGEQNFLFRFLILDAWQVSKCAPEYFRIAFFQNISDCFCMDTSIIFIFWSFALEPTNKHLQVQSQ